MTVITPSSAEVSGERLSPANLAAATAALRTDGFVVLPGVVDPEHLERLNTRMQKDLAVVRALPRVPHNFVWGHVQQSPPPTVELVFRDILANPLVCQVTSQLLGQEAYLNEISGNSNLPGSQAQPVHVDEGQLWPRLREAHPPARLAVNIPLRATTEENGAIELWPGSHLEDTNVIGHDLHVAEQALTQRPTHSPPIRATTPQGAVLIRDMRIWHRGTPNTSSAVRIMLAMVHNVAWIKRDSTSTLDRRCASLFDGCPIRSAFELSDHPGQDYLTRHEPYAYDGPP